MIDPPKYVTETYDLLLRMQEACLKEMTPGKSLKSVRSAAISFLKSEKRDYLIDCLPKTLGFAIGIDFRDNALALNSKSNVSFRNLMTFYLSLGFQGVPHKGSEKVCTVLFYFRILHLFSDSFMYIDFFPPCWGHC